MTRLFATRFLPIGLVVAASLAGCSGLQESKVDYRSADRGQALDVPPDLSRLSNQGRYQVPGQAASATRYNQQAQQDKGVVPNAVGTVQLQREGQRRWLVTSEPLDNVWAKVNQFWQANGFNVEVKQAQVGVIETNWAENRAKLPQDFIRESLGKLFENLYSTGELDKFRTRVERNPQGQTEIRISHRGMIEVYTNERSDRTVWQPRPSDPELENEFLRRLMIALGSTEVNASQAVASAPAPTATATLETANGAPVIRVAAGFDDAWRRVLLALDRTGFTVEDRDRSAGVFTVRYVPASLPGQNTEPGFFDKLFKRDQPQLGTETRQLVLRRAGEQTTVSVTDAQGGASPAAEAQAVLTVLMPELQ